MSHMSDRQPRVLRSLESDTVGTDAMDMLEESMGVVQCGGRKTVVVVNLCSGSSAAWTFAAMTSTVGDLELPTQIRKHHHHHQLGLSQSLATDKNFFTNTSSLSFRTNSGYMIKHMRSTVSVRAPFKANAVSSLVAAMRRWISIEVQSPVAQFTGYFP